MKEAERYADAAKLLPKPLFAAAMQLPEEMKFRAEELRLRAGYGLTAVIGGGEVDLRMGVTRDDVRDTAVNAAQGSLHTVADSICRGFITAPGGHRVGLCGTVITENGLIRGMRNFTSAAIRISKEIRGAAEELYAVMEKQGVLRSTLIVSPPGAGKTTILRDLIRMISDGGVRVGVTDERGEISGLDEAGDGAMFDIGKNTDVICGAPKKEAVTMLLRTMTPAVIAMDEITDPDDVAAIVRASNCGVSLYATVHGGSAAEAFERSGYEMLDKIFKRAVMIERRSDGSRRYVLEEREG